MNKECLKCGMSMEFLWKDSICHSCALNIITRDYEKQKKYLAKNVKSKINPEIKIVDESDKNYKEVLKRKLTHKIVWEDKSCNYFESEIQAKEELEYDKNKMESLK